MWHSFAHTPIWKVCKFSYVANTKYVNNTKKTCTLCFLRVHVCWSHENYPFHVSCDGQFNLMKYINPQVYSMGADFVESCKQHRSNTSVYWC